MECEETLVLCLNCSDTDGCSRDNDPKTYTFPADTCISPPHLWPGDPTWASFDVLDTVDAEEDDGHLVAGSGGNSSSTALKKKQSVTRKFFASENGTCAGEPTDSFKLPLAVCVGPYGKPRPWGVSSLNCSSSNASIDWRR
jgi:hypothetical protein